MGLCGFGGQPGPPVIFFRGIFCLQIKLSGEGFRRLRGFGWSWCSGRGVGSAPEKTGLKMLKMLKMLKIIEIPKMNKTRAAMGGNGGCKARKPACLVACLEAGGFWYWKQARNCGKISKPGCFNAQRGLEFGALPAVAPPPNY